VNEEGAPPKARIEGSRDRERASLALDVPVEPFANRIRVIVLQHPQEPDKVLGSAALLVRALKQAELRVGLSWRNLKAVAGADALPSEWAVLYLGSKSTKYPEPVNFVSQKGNPQPMPPGLKGLIVLDGTWTQAKALWWRNSWLLKLKRVVLQPASPSRYGNLRREPRGEALSTIESCALALSKMDPAGIALRSHLEGAFQRMLDEFKSRRGGGFPPTSPPATP
jgi:DTW domain-containing protein YfiP